MGTRTPRGVIRTYLAVTGVSTLSSSLIWGVNTLFLLASGLDIFEVMVANAFFTAGQLVFEVPTGVVADTVGRRASYLLSVTTVAIGTLVYLWAGLSGLGLVPFAAASLLLGLGFTFYTGAVDAWMVDALGATGHTADIDQVFARAGVVFGVAMLFGTTLGGVLGQVALWIPYAVRAALCVPAIAVGAVFMRELGFTPRPLELGSAGKEMAAIARAGVAHGTRHPVVGPLMAVSLVTGLFGMFGFYSWQRYFLDLLGRELIWVAGVVAALIGVSQIVGNLLVAPLVRRGVRRSTTLLVTAAFQAVAIGLAGLTRDFYVAVALYVAAGVAFGLAMPVRMAWLNACIPSGQRATIISLDSLYADAGGTAGQLGLGYLSRVVSIPAAWVVGGVIQLGALPLLRRARGRARTGDGDETCGPQPTAEATLTHEPPAP